MQINESISSQCALCHAAKPLMRSHFLPAAHYDRLKGNETGRHPIQISAHRQTAIETAYQFAKPLLCADCEHLFNANGEDLVLRWCSQNDADFPLQDALMALPPCDIVGGKKRFDASQLPPPFKAEPLIYFAVSIFWRGSVTNWLPPGQNSYASALGARYQEICRQYLLGEAQLPDTIVFTIGVQFCKPAQLVMYTPSFSIERPKLGKVFRHSFSIPGMRFMMMISDTFCRHKGQFSWPLFCEEGDLMQSPAHVQMLQMMATATPKGKLARQRDRERV